MEKSIEYVEPSYVLFKRSQPVRQLREDASMESRGSQKTAFPSSGASGSFRISHSRQSKIFRTKISQSYVPQKKEIPCKKDKNWHLRFCQSLQKSALKVIRWPNEKCTLAGSNLKKSSNVTITRKSRGFHDCLGEPKQTYVKIADPIAKIQPPKRTDCSSVPISADLPLPSPDLPPVPPSRTCAVPALPPRSSAVSPPPPPKSIPTGSTVPPPLSPQQLALFSVPQLDDGCVTLLQQLYYSPSSGYYSCSNSVDSCSPLPTDPAKKAPVIMASVKSTQVEKPLLQTAIAVDNYIIRPPPAYRCSQLPAPPPPPGPAPIAYTPVPVKNPPSYSSIAQSLAAIQLTDLDTACCIPAKPPLPLPTHPTRPVVTKIDHHSPIPKRKSDVAKNVRKLRNYSPQEFKFFMEQRIENLIKLSEQRRIRRLRLEEEMQKVGLSAEAQDEMRKMLHQKESNYLRQRRAKMNRSMFERIKRIGVGAFGEVTLVCKVDSGQLYAMKTLRKADVLRQKQVAHVKAERDILAEADNEWVVKLYFSFQDVENLYFVMEYIPGGDLMSLLIKFDIFKEDVAKFYLAELTCAVESVHMMGFIHRDIKPDNILIDRDGHIKLTDFGLCTGFRWTHNSKYYEGDSHSRQDSLELTDEVNCHCPKVLERRRRREHRRCLAHSLVGTPNYIAPEVLLRTGYTQLCDWWSVGVVLYEMLIGCPPFAAQSPMETQHKIKNWQNSLTIPTEPKVSPEAIDLILKLCTSPEKRLGKNTSEIKKHPFLASIDFERGVRKLTPPYIPVIRYPMDTSNFDTCSQTDSEGSFDTSSSSLYGDPNDKQSHGFFEFTFRRFFDDAGGVSLETKMAATPEAAKSRAAIYV